MNHPLSVTRTFYKDARYDDLAVRRKQISKRIRSRAIMKGETMSDWGRELGISRSMIHQVVTGIRRTGYIREFIEQRLNETFWPPSPSGKA